MQEALKAICDPYLGYSLDHFSPQWNGHKLTLTLPYAGLGTTAELQRLITEKTGKEIELQLKVAVEKVNPHPKAKPIENVKNVILVASAKGGVGKSTVAANLALALQAEGARVGILDADLYGPSQAQMLGVENLRPKLEGHKMYPLVGHGIQITSIANHLNREDAPLIWRGAQLHQALTTLLYDTLWTDLDYLIVDTPPGTGDIQLTLTQSIAVDGAVIVSTPQHIALLDAKKGLKMFKQMQVPLLGVIENMNMFICPHCGKTSHIFGHDGAQLMSLQYVVNFLGSLPLDEKIQAQTDKGNPPVAQDPNSEISQIFRDMARTIAAAAILENARREPTIPQQTSDLIKVSSGHKQEIKWNI